MVNLLQNKIRENDGSDVWKVVISTEGKKEDNEGRKLPKKFQDVILQTLLDEDDS